MSASTITCPRCEGRRLVRTTTYRQSADGELLAERVDVVCPICSGSGRASLSELIGRRAGAREVRHAA